MWCWHWSQEISQKSLESQIHFSAFRSVTSSLLQSSPQLWSMLSLLSAQLFSPLVFCSTHPTSGLVSAASSLCTLSSRTAFCFATHLGSFWVGSPSSSCLTETRGAVLGLSGGWMGVSISISSTFTCTVHTTKSQKKKSVQASHKDKKSVEQECIYILSCSCGSILGSMKGTLGSWPRSFSSLGWLESVTSGFQPVFRFPPSRDSLFFAFLFPIGNQASEVRGKSQGFHERAI